MRKAWEKRYPAETRPVDLQDLGCRSLSSQNSIKSPRKLNRARHAHPTQHQHPDDRAAEPPMIVWLSSVETSCLRRWPHTSCTRMPLHPITLPISVGFLCLHTSKNRSCRNSSTPLPRTARSYSNIWQLPKWSASPMVLCVHQQPRETRNVTHICRSGDRVEVVGYHIRIFA